MAIKGSVALLFKQRNFLGGTLSRSNRTDHSYQRRKLVGERHCIGAVDHKLSLADVYQRDADEHRAGRPDESVHGSGGEGQQHSPTATVRMARVMLV